MKIFGIIMFNVILAFLFVFVGIFFEHNLFLNEFLKTQILPISATIVGFNISAVIFLISHLLGINGDFLNSKKEMKHNIYLMGLCFIVIVFLLFMNPTPLNYMFDLFYKTIIMTFFFLQIYAVYELINVIFNLKSI